MAHAASSLGPQPPTTPREEQISESAQIMGPSDVDRQREDKSPQARPVSFSIQEQSLLLLAQSTPLPDSPPSTPLTARPGVYFPDQQHGTSGFAQQTRSSDTAHRYGVVNRRPQGWISSLDHPRAVSGLSPDFKFAQFQRSTSAPAPVTGDVNGVEQLENADEDCSHDQEPPDYPPAPSQVPLVYEQRSRSGRRVSGAMQHALTPTPREHAWSTQSSDLEVSPEMAGELNESMASLTLGSLAGLSLDTPADHDDHLGFDAGAEAGPLTRNDVTLAQVQDEQWMSHVRAQLGVLFPDFFEADSPTIEHDPGVSSHQTHGRPYGSHQVPVPSRPSTPHHHSPDCHAPWTPRRTPPTGSFTPASSPESPTRTPRDSFYPGWSTPGDTSLGTTEDASSLATPDSRSGLIGRIGGAVPNVREEISGLRHEIMRLRSVVGGLAEGMRVAAVTVPISPPAQAATLTSTTSPTLGLSRTPELFEESLHQQIRAERENAPSPELRSEIRLHGHVGTMNQAEQAVDTDKTVDNSVEGEREQNTWNLYLTPSSR
ncbi:hypothetical protein IAU60_005001 [Kwoniella sp. DSM 27419]